MPGDTCVVCGNTRATDPSVSFHHFPANPEKRAVWLRVFQLDESDLKPYSRVCSRHFPDGDAKKRNNVRVLPGTATYIIYTTHQYIGVVGDKKEIASLNVELQNQFSKLTLLGFFEARKRYVSFCCCIQVD